MVIGNMGNSPLCGNTIRDSDAAAGGRIRKERGGEDQGMEIP